MKKKSLVQLLYPFIFLLFCSFVFSFLLLSSLSGFFSFNPLLLSLHIFPEAAVFCPVPPAPAPPTDAIAISSIVS